MNSFQVLNSLAAFSGWCSGGFAASFWSQGTHYMYADTNYSVECWWRCLESRKLGRLWTNIRLTQLIKYCILHWDAIQVRMILPFRPAIGIMGYTLEAWKKDSVVVVQEVLIRVVFNGHFVCAII
jgi:hypothetical protein